MLSELQIKKRIQCGRYSKNDIKNLLGDAKRRNEQSRVDLIEGLVDDAFNVLNPTPFATIETTKKERRKILEGDYENPDIQVANKFLQIRESALNRNLEFNLSLIDVKKLLTQNMTSFVKNTGRDLRRSLC